MPHGAHMQVRLDPKATKLVKAIIEATRRSASAEVSLAVLAFFAKKKK